ncbi:MAG: hypothetical protein E7294_03555 [Lachnospiraceae bacterium]|jgi:hypothetical protein|nr:hypothetical protein [Lachnospiraceae bacterium]
MVEKQWKEMKKEEKAVCIGSLGLAGITILALVLFALFCMDNLMHSDMSAEVILSKLLADEHKLVMTKDWYYSTELRVIYSQLIMTPLFYVFKSYRLVKQISILIFYVLLVFAYRKLVKRIHVEKSFELLGLALLFAPLSNEYLDMLLIGCFYTSQVICTYLLLSLFFKKKEKTKEWLLQGAVFTVAAFILGLSGLRYLASLFIPVVLAGFFLLCELEEPLKKETFYGAILRERLHVLLFALAGLLGALAGFLVNKFVLAKQYSFDTTSEVAFVPLSEVPGRFLDSIRLMFEFFGYTQIQAVTPRGIVNVIKAAFFALIVGASLYLWKNRRTLLTEVEKLLFYYFLAAFLLNWYMLVFTNVLLQYRYWLPVYVIGVFVLLLFFKVYHPKNQLPVWTLTALCVFTVLGSLYGELWQDVKYNDCEKRYAYMDFLEENEYDFGYATFWNASVSEYLSNGTIHVASLGLNDLEQPYKWLQPKWYYQKGYHTGRCFLLLANSEAAGMEKGDFTIMDHPKLVYKDEYYSIYEDDGGMYIFE